MMKKRGVKTVAVHVARIASQGPVIPREADDSSSDSLVGDNGFRLKNERRFMADPKKHPLKLPKTDRGFCLNVKTSRKGLKIAKSVMKKA
jgi:hypothetical protein